MMRVLLADADLIERSAIVLLLKHKLGIQEFCEISDAGPLAERVQQFEPDLILMDWDLPGLEVNRIRREFQCSRVHPLVIVMSTRSENEPWALASGADAFLNKHASGEEVLELIKKFIAER